MTGVYTILMNFDYDHEFLEIASKIEDIELQAHILTIFKDLIKEDIGKDKQSNDLYNIKDIFQRLDKKQNTEVTISDLQQEINQVKKDIILLKTDMTSSSISYYLQRFN